MLIGAVVGGVAGLRGETSRPPQTLLVDHDPVAGPAVPIHVSGLVVSPGVVWVAEGSLTADAIAAAGGALAGADLDSLNLAQPVYEGDHIVVGSIEPIEADGGGPGDGLIDINRASPAELESLPGVGPVLAANIVAYRESNGRFETVEDLLEVPGIGETRLASIRDLIRPP